MFQSAFADYAGHYPAAVIGDYDGDHVPDVLLATGDSSKSLTLMRGLGNGRFARGTDQAVPEQINATIAGDFNGDGKADVAYTSGAGKVVVRLGNGDGSFQGASSYTIDNGVARLRAVDLDGDGDLDLLASSGANGGRVYVLLNDGAGSFQAPQPYSTGSTVYDIVTGDLDGDHHPDVIGLSPYPYSVVVVLSGNGDGTLRAPVTYPTGNNVQTMAIGDLNGDGHPDLVLSQSMSNRYLTILLGTSAGGFTTLGDLSIPTDVNSSFPVPSLGIADVDHDGKADVVATSPYGHVMLLTGKGDGTFATPQLWRLGANKMTMALADLDADGFVDAAITGTNAYGTLMVARGRADGSLDLGRAIPAGEKSYVLAAGHFNNRPAPDIVVNDYLNSRLQLFSNDGTGHFPSPYLDGDAGAASLLVTDLDGDGRDDLVSANSKSYGLLVRHGLATGGLGAAQYVTTSYQPDSLASADFNNDGIADLVVGTDDAGLNSHVTILLGRADGAYVAQDPIQVPRYVRSLATADINRDGKADVIFSSSNQGGMVLYGDGRGYYAGIPYDLGYSAASKVLVADLNHDGTDDLVALSYGSVTIYLGRATGGLDYFAFYSVGVVATDLAIADLDGDGELDLVAVDSAYDSRVSIVPGTGDGTFDVPVQYSAGPQASHIAIADIDEDGRLDLAFSSSLDYQPVTVTVLRNVSTLNRTFVDGFERR